jgi:predicted nucleic acid-binding protein
MTLSSEISRLTSIFIDTAPIIYYIEANQPFGLLAKEVVDCLQSENIAAYTSVITLTEVLVKPFEKGNDNLALKFSTFLRYSNSIDLLEINAKIAEEAGRLRGKYPSLRTMDALQIAAALNISADAFITNDINLKQINEIKVIVLKDFLSERF